MSSILQSINNRGLVGSCLLVVLKQQTNEFNQPKYLTNTLDSQSEFIICKFCFENEISKKHLERFHYVTRGVNRGM